MGAIAKMVSCVEEVEAKEVEEVEAKKVEEVFFYSTVLRNASLVIFHWVSAREVTQSLV